MQTPPPGPADHGGQGGMATRRARPPQLAVADRVAGLTNRSRVTSVHGRRRWTGPDTGADRDARLRRALRRGGARPRGHRAGFWIQPHQVTNAEFAEFVDATGYVTVAERPPDPDDYPGAPPENLQPGSMVFHRTPGPVDLRHLNQWWTWTPGACWNHPRGPRSSTTGRERHPVVHVAFDDAAAYADWAGLALPTEAQWEVAARGGLDGTTYTWGDEPEAPGPDARQLLARRVPLPPRHRLRHHPAGRQLRPPTATASSTWRATSGSGPPTGGPTPRAIESCCAADSYDPAPAAVPDRPQGHQGRVVPVRRQLLPALPARGAPPADGRHRDEPHRVPLRRTG